MTCAAQKLPAELMLTIFLTIAQTSSTGSRALGAFASTCRYWYTVMYQTPSLWSYIRHASYEETLRLLVRSGDSPLQIVFGDHAHRIRGYHNDLKPVRATLAHLYRIKSIELYCNGPAMKLLYQHIHLTSAPLLTSLKLTCRYGDAPPKQFIILDAPALEVLEMWNLKPRDITFSLPPTLRFLNIRCSSLLETGHIPLLQLCKALGSLINLNSLLLHAALLDDPPCGDVLDNSIHLPALTTLGLVESIPNVCALLKILSIPAIEVLSIHRGWSTNGAPTSDLELTELVSQLGSSVPHFLVPNASLRVASTESDDGEELSFHFSRGTDLHSAKLLLFTIQVADDNHDLDLVDFGALNQLFKRLAPCKMEISLHVMEPRNTARVIGILSASIRSLTILCDTKSKYHTPGNLSKLLIAATDVGVQHVEIQGFDFSRVDISNELGGIMHHRILTLSLKDCHGLELHHLNILKQLVANVLRDEG
jgi:hypothetical protein